MAATLSSPASSRWRASPAVVVTGCLIAYVALACLLYWPASPWNDTRLPSVPFGGFGYGDPAVLSWFLAWTPFALTHGLNPLSTSFLDVPRGVNLASNTSVPALGLLGWPVTSTLGPVAAFNVLLRLAFATSAASMFLVLRVWCRWWIAFVGGLFFGFSPYVVTQSTHLNLAFIPLLPVLAFLVYDLLSGHRHEPRRTGLVLGAVAGVQVLIDPELLAMFAAVCVLGVAALALVDRRRWPGRVRPIVRSAPWALVTFALVAGFYLAWMFIGPGHVSGPPLPASTLAHLQTDLLAPIVPTLNQQLLPYALVGVAGHFDHGNFTENDGYLGVAFIIWVGVVATRYRKDRVVLYGALAALAALVLSLGSPLTIDGRATSIPLPEVLLSRVPLFDHVVPSRFAAIVLLFAVIAGAVGAERFVANLGTRAKRASRLGEMAMVLLALASVALAFPQVAQVTKAPNWPNAVYGALAAVPHDAVVLTYPFPEDPYTEAMTWQSQEGFAFRLVGGYADIPSEGGHGQVNPPNLDPVQVQGFLMEAQYGHVYQYPAPSASFDMRAALCTFVRRYHVGAIVWWRVGAHPRLVRALVESDFGGPRSSTVGGAIEVWRTNATACRGA